MTTLTVGEGGSQLSWDVCLGLGFAFADSERKMKMQVEEMIWTTDPVKAAVKLFGGTDDNRRLWGRYCKRLGRDRFRELLFQKFRENKVDGEPRNPPAAFQAMLCKVLPKYN